MAIAWTDGALAEIPVQWMRVKAVVPVTQMDGVNLQNIELRAVMGALGSPVYWDNFFLRYNRYKPEDILTAIDDINLEIDDINLEIDDINLEIDDINLEIDDINLKLDDIESMLDKVVNCLCSSNTFEEFKTCVCEPEE